MIIYAVTNGFLDDVPVNRVREWERASTSSWRRKFPQVGEGIRTEKALSKDTEADAQAARRSSDVQEVRRGEASRIGHSPSHITIPAPIHGLTRDDGQRPRTQGPHQVRREHAQDHAHDGDGRDVEDEARAGSRDGGASVRATRSREVIVEPVFAGARRAVSAAASAGAASSARRCVLLTSNRGLAGAFNSNLIKEARATASRGSTRRASRSSCTSSARRASATSGTSAARWRRSAPTSAIGRRPTDAASARRRLDGAFRAGELDAVYVVYAKFKSALSTPPHTEQMLPVTPPERKGAAARLPAVPVGRSDSRRAAAVVRAQRGVSRAGGERRPATRARSAPR